MITLREETKNYISIVREELEKMKVLEPIDIENLNFLSTQVELYNRAMENIDTNGLTVINAHHETVANPAISIQRNAMSAIVSLLKELSISTRQRRMLIKDNIIDQSSPIEKLFEIVNV